MTSGGSGPGTHALMSRKSGCAVRKVSKRSFSSGFIFQCLPHSRYSSSAFVASAVNPKCFVTRLVTIQTALWKHGLLQQFHLDRMTLLDCDHRNVFLAERCLRA